MDANSAAHPVAYWVGAILGLLLVGAICGCLPLKLGENRNRIGLGRVGFGLCLVSGLLFGWLGAAPMAVIMSIVILIAGKPARKSKRAKSTLGPRRPSLTFDAPPWRPTIPRSATLAGNRRTLR